MKIKTRVCLTFGIIITLILLGTGFYGVLMFQDNSLKSNNTLLKTKAELMRNSLNEKLENIFSTLRFAAKDIDITEDSKIVNQAEAMDTLTKLYNHIPSYDTYLTLLDGSCLDYIDQTLSTIETFDPRALKREWFLGIIDEKKKQLVTKPYVSTAGNNVMAYSVPVLNNNKTVGTLCINIDLERITNYIASLSDNKDFFVTNGEGFVFASKNPEDIGKNIYKLIPAFKKYEDQKNAEFDFIWSEDNNEKFRAHSTSLIIMDWKFWQYKSYNEIEEAGNKYLISSLVIFIILITIALFIIFIFAGKISKPISYSSKLLLTLADEGSTDHQINEKYLQRNDEIGDLQKALKQLIYILHKKSGVAKTIASGDLKVDITVLSQKDELGLAFTQMANNLNSTLSQVNTAVGQVTNGANQISSSSQSLSSGATEQAASLEEITSTMTELGSQTTANAENATAAKDLAADAATAATTGQERMNKLTQAMTQISKNADETQKVIKTIDDIAFQTNLLALNAAVEAARAGVHGKGFAVVAEEVRNLAARSAKAAAETADLIQNSNNQIEEGVNISQQTAEALDVISANVTKTTDTISEIAIASSEQANGIKQINIGLTQIDAVTQQNTANAEETASASEEMSSMATVLQQLVRHFKLKTDRPELQPNRKISQTAKKRNTSENTGWADTPSKKNSAIIEPTEQIKLDDNEFGKF